MVLGFYFSRREIFFNNGTWGPVICGHSCLDISTHNINSGEDIYVGNRVLFLMHSSFALGSINLTSNLMLSDVGAGETHEIKMLHLSL